MNTGLILSVICGAIVIVFTFQKHKKLQTVNPNRVKISEIWLFGLLAFLFGFMGQVLGMIEMFDTIEASGDIAPSLVSSGIKHTMWNTGTGLLILIISVILWSIVNAEKKSKIDSWKE